MSARLMMALGMMVALRWASTPCVAADQEVLVLKDGQRVTGQVVAEKPTTYFVDLGFDVIKIPKDQVIERRKATDPPKDLPRPSDTVLIDSDPSNFYRSADLKPKQVNELVKEFGEGVVSVETPSGMGSGFIINDDGYMLTNNHVIEGETRLSVVVYHTTDKGLVRKRIENVEIIALNPFVDLALLKIPSQPDFKLKPVYLGTLQSVSAGDGTFAVGNPLGLERSVSQGIISTLNRNFEGLIYIQTDTAINPGNSGGPLFNMKGEVIGVTNMGFRGADNLGFAIPINYVKDFLRNREAFSYDKDNPNTGYRYVEPPSRRRAGNPPVTLTSPAVPTSESK